MDELCCTPNGVCRRPIRDEEDPGTTIANPVSAIRVLAFCQQFDCLLYRGAHRRVCGCGQRRCKEVLDRCEVRFDTNWAEGYDRNIHPLRSKRVGEQLVPEELEPFIKLLDRLTGHRTRVVQYQDNGASVLRIVYKLVTAKWRLLKGILCHAFPRAQNTKRHQLNTLVAIKLRSQPKTSKKLVLVRFTALTERLLVRFQFRDGRRRPSRQSCRIWSRSIGPTVEDAVARRTIRRGGACCPSLRTVRDSRGSHDRVRWSRKSSPRFARSHWTVRLQRLPGCSQLCLRCRPRGGRTRCWLNYNSRPGTPLPRWRQRQDRQGVPTRFVDCALLA